MHNNTVFMGREQDTVHGEVKYLESENVAAEYIFHIQWHYIILKCNRLIMVHIKV